MKLVEFAPAARSELEAAIDRYERQRTGRGWRFYAAVERAVKLLAAFPAAGPLFRDVPPERGVRRRIVRGFPFRARVSRARRHHSDRRRRPHASSTCVLA